MSRACSRNTSPGRRMRAVISAICCRCLIPRERCRESAITSSKPRPQWAARCCLRIRRAISTSRRAPIPRDSSLPRSCGGPGAGMRRGVRPRGPGVAGDVLRRLGRGQRLRGFGIPPERRHGMRENAWLAGSPADPQRRLIQIGTLSPAEGGGYPTRRRTCGECRN